MLDFTITDTNESVPAGAYEATFKEIEPTETEKGKAYRWCFTIDKGDYKGRHVSYLSDGEYPPSSKNKTGRWLAALAGKPLTCGLNVKPNDYVGKRYMLIVEAKGGDKPRLTTFTQLA